MRKRVEEVSGWVKTVGGGRKLRYRGVDRNQRHHDIHYDHVGLDTLGDPHRSLAIASLADNLESTRTLQHFPQAIPHDLMIVHEQHSSKCG